MVLIRGGATYYNNNSSLPVYKWTTYQTHFSVEELAKELSDGISSYFPIT